MRKPSGAKGITPFAPSILKEGFDPNGLYYATLKLRTRTITVTEPKYGVEDLRSAEARKVLLLDIEDVNRKNALLLTYSSLAAISTGDVPAPEELHELADADVKFWITQARKVAPQLFDWMDEVDKLSAKAKEKKKGK
jgi:hypothetical protein